ncbi:MAG TPA: DUF1153 domain-containing protein, partial [Blastocatellia bacterium]|nr:DUF1153 domain-containing protein [Blastocatellia bacterium]
MNTLISEKKLQPLPIISEGDLIYASFEELTALLDTGHWTNTRKKLVVKAVMAKMVSLSQIRERYGIDNFEIYCWCHNFGLGDRIHDG